MMFPPRTAALLLVQAAAFWPVWVWYAKRASDGSDEPWGLVPLLLAVLLFGRLPRAESPALSLRAGALATLLYAAAFPLAPPLLRAALALVALALTAAPLRDSAGSAAHLGLLLLSLPVMASLQFYLGLPLRAASGLVAAALLSLSGFSVVADGTCLRFGSELLAIDAPCSGVRMLWGATFLALALAALLRLPLARTVALTAATVGTVVVANGVRAAALFFPEAGILVAPPWAHSAIGFVTFAGVAFLVLRGAFVLVPPEARR
ncbi:MAG TPA: archaeosortase/exosortase family protein [Vicinamibacteria bacterium]|nr:archaeosortase/exosortase family protein [Vicinamibacteria bacterium]